MSTPIIVNKYIGKDAGKIRTDIKFIATQLNSINRILHNPIM